MAAIREHEGMVRMDKEDQDPNRIIIIKEIKHSNHKDNKLQSPPGRNDYNNDDYNE